MHIYIKNHDQRPGKLRLARCAGIRDVGGETVACPPGCIAHFDAWGPPAPGNSILSWVGYLPETIKTASWSTQQHPCMVGNPVASVHMWGSTDAFCGPEGEEATVMVVIVENDSDASRDAAAFTDMRAAVDFFNAEVTNYSADCSCVMLPHLRPELHTSS